MNGNVKNEDQDSVEIKRQESMQFQFRFGVLWILMPAGGLVGMIGALLISTMFNPDLAGPIWANMKYEDIPPVARLTIFISLVIGGLVGGLLPVFAWRRWVSKDKMLGKNLREHLLNNTWPEDLERRRVSGYSMMLGVLALTLLSELLRRLNASFWWISLAAAAIWFLIWLVRSGHQTPKN